MPEIEVALSSVGTNAVIQSAVLYLLDIEKWEKVTTLLKKCAAAFIRGDDNIGCAGVTEHMIELYLWQ